ncbi:MULTISPECIES: ATP-binding protein [Rhodococcus]|uniref:ATP-binding protein n=1 Tax=Rhodococcus TaxID=1827 RepID=UPI000EA9AA86|nr:LuxR family transcriptional regulator [Rhodococcus sp. A14]QZS56797.1 LuxR C-terminal-related transcriptional regulator [Rhodococcus opacus]RKM76574.1 LuxR family transcriptional regulator [Rhodococcus opacus]
MASRSANQPDNLPADLTSFVGRRSETHAVRQLLSADRLVTLTGVGGVGKTRLALRVARDIRRAFPDGVCLVELASLKDPDLLPHTLIDALGIREQSAPAPLVLTDYLRPRHTLLVLDNCEHILEAAADLVDRLLRAAPKLRILATSRQALMIAGEHVYPVPTLPVPDVDVRLTPGSATQFAAVNLFAARAAAVVPGFEITPDNEHTVIQLCQRLEGIPLAIELAAVRLRVLTVEELAHRLRRRFELLREGSRNLPERHQTLQALIDWSYELCTPTEQTLWARASVFAGGFALDALEAVCSDELLPADTLLDTVAGLTDKSILIRGEQGGRVRFRMLETIREYGQARLREGTSETAVQRKHRDWYWRLIEKAAAEWFGPRQEDWANLLRVEHPNVRAALEFCLARPDEVRVGLRMAGLPWFLWIALGFMPEGRLWLDRALALDQESSPDRVWALGTAAHIAVFQGDETAAAALIDAVQELAVQLDEPKGLAYAAHMRGLRALGSDLSAAIPLLVEALERYGCADVPADYPNSVRPALTMAYVLSGELDRAAGVVEEAYEQCEQAGERWLLSYAMWAKGFLRLLQGELEQAEAFLCEALQLKRFTEDNLGLAFILDVLAWTAAASVDSERAAVLLGASDQVWQTVGVPLFGAKHLLARREQFEDVARQAMGNSRFDTAFARGGQLTVEDMLTFALRERRVSRVGPRQADSLLTPREREVADLVAQGMSSKDVAAKLVISRRTVDVHIEHIFAKLGFNSRTQIATWVAQQGSRRDGG